MGHLRKKEYLGKSRFGKREFHQGEVDPKFPQGDMVRVRVRRVRRARRYGERL